MSINFVVPSKFWVHQIIKFGRNYSNQSPLPSCSILTTQENASAKATKFYTQMPQSPYSSDICTSTCDGSTWNLNLKEMVQFSIWINVALGIAQKKGKS